MKNPRLKIRDQLYFGNISFLDIVTGVRSGQPSGTYKLFPSEVTTDRSKSVK